MKKTDLAYLAGIFDGEGCIVIHDRKYVRKDGEISIHAYAEVNLANTNEWIVRQFFFAFGVNVYLRKKQILQKQAIWVWQICARSVITPLKTLLPYLKLKHEQARIALDFQLKKNSVNRHPLSKEEVNWQKTIKDKISLLNRPIRKKEGESAS